MKNTLKNLIKFTLPATLLLAAGNANAILVATITSTANVSTTADVTTVTITDGGANDGFATVAGHIVYNFADAYGNVVSFSATSEAPSIGELVDVELQSQIGADSTLLITVYDDSYNLGQAGDTFLATSHTTATNVFSNTFVSTSVDGQAVLTNSQLVAGVDSTGSALITLAGNPSTITHTFFTDNTGGSAITRSTTTDTTTRVSEPALAGLMGLGLLGLGFARRRQQKV